MIDCHFHLWTTDESTPEKRAERAEQLREEMERQGVDRLCLIGEVGDTIEECREANRTVAKYVAEYPESFYGWARVDPRLGDDAVAEFRRAVEEDGLVGLKHHFIPTPINISDPEFFPLAEAAVDMDVPVIAHVMQRLPADQERWDDSEAHTEDVLELAQRYPELKLVSAHIVAGGDAEYRIKTVADQENVILDISGSNCERGYVERAAERLGTDRLVFGTDTWFAPGVGKLSGLNLSSEARADIAYGIHDLFRDDQPGRFTDGELAERKAAAAERFAASDESRREGAVDVNAFVGHWPFRDLDASADALLSLMDEAGVDAALVSSLESVFYRNVHAGNRDLRDRVAGHEERLFPLATINPTYPEWETDLRECVEEWGWSGVKLLPAYHDYDLDAPETTALFDVCADLDVPVVVCATLEDQRQRHPRVTLRGFEDGGTRAFTDGHVDALVDLLTECPETDVVLADLWTHAPRIVEECCRVRRNGVRLDNRVRSGETLFVLDDLFVYFSHQGERLVEEVGVDRLVRGPQLPFKIAEAYDGYVDLLPASDDDRARVGGDTLRSVFGLDG
ncbi:amidohydrolase family protein [Halomarina oriensis]|uniref:amidohydrolase family protein n=1 Tax=Halomarina oriensis TaxID=671145 RepID=UPI00130334C5